jgi:hypothetical protein
MNTSAAESPSILLILPYFGALPRSADLFFRSCAANPRVNWLLVTDQRMDESRLPSNVALRHTTFPALKKSIDDIMGFATVLPTPYKLCDFRPAYGVIFADAIGGYDFWGHCDMDMIFGDVRKFITDDILQKYNKVLIHGHLSLYRNCEEANHYFQLEAPGVSFREVFTSSQNRAFDEFGGVRLLLTEHGIPFFRDDNYLADIDSHVHQFRTVQAPNYRHQCFYWEDGRVFKAFWSGGTAGRQEYMYIHLQKRSMGQLSLAPGEKTGAWYITPHGFVAKTSAPGAPADMDRLNPRNVLFDSRQYVSSSLWHIKRALSVGR